MCGRVRCAGVIWMLMGTSTIRCSSVIWNRHGWHASGRCAVRHRCRCWWSLILVADSSRKLSFRRRWRCARRSQMYAAVRWRLRRRFGVAGDAVQHRGPFWCAWMPCVANRLASRRISQRGWPLRRICSNANGWIGGVSVYLAWRSQCLSRLTEPVFTPLGGGSVCAAWWGQCLRRLVGAVFAPLGGGSVCAAWRGQCLSRLVESVFILLGGRRLVSSRDKRCARYPAIWPYPQGAGWCRCARYRPPGGTG